MECRKHHGALFHASAIFFADHVAISGNAQHFRERYFCPRCGSSVFSRSDNEIELHIGAFDKIDQFKPTYELWTIRREGWLPEFAGLKPHQRNRDE